MHRYSFQYITSNVIAVRVRTTKARITLIFGIQLKSELTEFLYSMNVYSTIYNIYYFCPL